MHVGLVDTDAAPRPRPVARVQFSPQMTPLVAELPRSHGNRLRVPQPAQLLSVERISASGRLVENAAEVDRDRPLSIVMLAEAVQLRMMTIPARLTPQHRLRKKRLTPERDQPCGIEILGMQGPEAQSFGFR